MKTYALVRYDKEDNEINLAGTYFFPETAQVMAHGYGARGKWADSDGHALVVADQTLYDSKATWYVAPVEVMPVYDWEAAWATIKLLGTILGGIARKAWPW